jgi:hypothetical protein
MKHWVWIWSINKATFIRVWSPFIATTKGMASALQDRNIDNCFSWSEGNCVLCVCTTGSSKQHFFVWVANDFVMFWGGNDQKTMGHILDYLPWKFAWLLSITFEGIFSQTPYCASTSAFIFIWCDLRYFYWVHIRDYCMIKETFRTAVKCQSGVGSTSAS